MALPLKDLISLVEQNREKMGEQPQDFISSMIAKRDKFGDRLYASPRQMKYPRSLAGQFCEMPEESERPKSNLQILREKRDALLKASRKRAGRERERQFDQFAVVGKLKAGELAVKDAPTAKIRRARTYKLDHKNNPQPVKTAARS